MVAHKKTPHSTINIRLAKAADKKPLEKWMLMTNMNTASGAFRFAVDEAIRLREETQRQQAMIAELRMAVSVRDQVINDAKLAAQRLVDQTAQDDLFT